MLFFQKKIKKTEKSLTFRLKNLGVQKVQKKRGHFGVLKKDLKKDRAPHLKVFKKKMQKKDRAPDHLFKSEKKNIFFKKKCFFFTFFQKKRQAKHRSGLENPKKPLIYRLENYENKIGPQI